MPNADEFEWIQRALARYEQPLLRFAIQLVGHAHAQDIVQDTFLALCKAERSDIEQRLAPWLFIVCKRRALDLLRERRRLSPLDENGSMTSLDSQPLSCAERRQSMSRVQAIVERLPEKQRQVLILRFSTGMSYKQIAEVMELSVTHVGVLLHQAIKGIRKQLRENTATETESETESVNTR
jgi:RNA polymerase sigma-70 factor (ECF subfamily)